MSRVGRKLIVLPAGVTAVLNGKNVAIKGPKGTLDFTFHKDMEIVSENNTISVTRPSDSLEHRALHGTTRALLNNMVLGVTTGFAKTLDIKGVGYRASLKDSRTLVLNVGYSNPVEIPIPAGQHRNHGEGRGQAGRRRIRGLHPQSPRTRAVSRQGHPVSRRARTPQGRKNC